MDNLDFNFFCLDCKQTAAYRKENCFTRYSVRHYKKGNYIAFKGDRVKELSILTEGAINVSFVLESGLIIRSIDHQAPSPIGAIAILSKEGKYMADTQAIEPATTINISREDLIVQMGKCGDFMVNFIDFSASRIGILSDHIALLSQRSISAKLAYYVFVNSQDGINYSFKKSIREVSEHLCVERPSLSRIIAKFVDQGLITYHNGVGEIVDIKGLSAIIE